MNRFKKFYVLTMQRIASLLYTMAIQNVMNCVFMMLEDTQMKIFLHLIGHEKSKTLEMQVDMNIVYVKDQTLVHQLKVLVELLLLLLM
jgi:hypothetical protein